jgi:hypothetical protein|tara:strand:+ start:1048 stop:1182 length:135 start_codon:yes stop_codon:yes gene_type:complete
MFSTKEQFEEWASKQKQVYGISVPFDLDSDDKEDTEQLMELYAH